MTTGRTRVLVVGHDRGGVNLLTPLLSHWQKMPNLIEATFLSTPEIEYEVSCLMPSVKLISRSHPLRRWRQTSWMYSDAELESIVRDGKWNLVLTGTSLRSELEKLVCKWARRCSIPSATIVDMWTEYRIRFQLGSSLILPDVLLVLDERMLDEVRSVFGSEPKIEVTGSPHFSRLIERSRQNTEPTGAIRFISEPVAECFPNARIHEFAIAELIIDTLDAVGRASELVLRPHPRDDVEAWRRFAFAHRDKGVRLDDEPSWSCHLSTSMVIGLSSMMLIELAIAGIPTASYRFPGADESYYCLPEQDFGIRVLRSRSDMADWFERADYPHIRDDFIALHENSIARITDFVLDGGHS